MLYFLVNVLRSLFAFLRAALGLFGFIPLDQRYQDNFFSQVAEVISCGARRAFNMYNSNLRSKHDPNFHNYRKDNPEKTNTKAAVVGCGISSSPLSSTCKLNGTAPGTRCQAAPAMEGCVTKCLGFQLLGSLPLAEAAAATCFPGR